MPIRRRIASPSWPELAGAACLAMIALTLALAAPAEAADGTWERAWGKDVGGAAVDLCTVAASCQAGTPAGLGGAFGAANAIAPA